MMRVLLLGAHLATFGACADASPGVSVLRGAGEHSVVELTDYAATTTEDPGEAYVRTGRGGENATWYQWFQVWSWWLLPFAALYGVVSLVALKRFPEGTPQHKAAITLLCCWKDVLSMSSCWFWNCLFSPCLCAGHYVRIYVCETTQIYCIRLKWRLFHCCLKLYEDPDFGPNDKSLGKVSGDTANEAAGKNEDKYKWMRLGDFSRPAGQEKPTAPKLHTTNMQLFCGRIEAGDVLQGALGDCWLEASMAILAEHEGAIESIFVTKEVTPDGKYSVRLYDPQEKKWVIVTVDDYVPCISSASAPDGVARDSKTGMPRQVYAQCHGTEIWACIIEKAFAKFCGNFSKIEAGFTEWGLSVMTGKPAWRFELSDMQSGNQKWKRIDLVCEKDPKDPTDKRYANFRSTQVAHDHEEFFQVLQHYHRNGALCCCGGVKDPGVEKGLIQGHAFSILNVCQVGKSGMGSVGEFFRMVQVRNPWGTGEWTGPWSDKSDLWTKYPQVKKALQQEDKDDGCYWMQWEDFIQYWGYVGCVDMDVDIFSVTQPLYNDRELTGPLQAFAKGSFEYCCMCHGARHLLVSHHSSSKAIEAKDFQSTCGVDPSGCYCKICEGGYVSVDQGELKRAKASTKKGCAIL